MSIVSGLLPGVLGNVGFVNNLLTSIGVVISFIPQFAQNGNGKFGLLPSPVLPPFLDGPHPEQKPWGDRTANGTNYYEDVPDTGMTRYYELNITRKTFAPDGVPKEMLVANDQFPGPLIDANWGDWVHVTINNQIQGPEEGTSIHWHGFQQKGTPQFDGVPSVTQCPIAPGSSMVYHFRADLYGSAWYHSHYSAQYADGLYGPIVVYGPRNYDYDIDLGPIMLTDYFHQPYREVFKQLLGTGKLAAQLTFADNTLVQGKMRYDCTKVPAGTTCAEAGLAKFRFQHGKVHKLRFINTSSYAVMLISIDSHIMTVVSNDFVPVKAYTTKKIVLAAGQRSEVLVMAKPLVHADNGAYWLRVRQPIGCAIAYQPFALGAIYYEGQEDTAAPQSLPHSDWVEPRLLDCQNDPLSLTEPSFPISLPEPDATLHLDVTQTINATGYTLYEVNHSSYYGNYNIPILRQFDRGNTTFERHLNIYDFGVAQHIRIVIQNNTPVPHPFHIHGQNMFVVASGTGAWDNRTIVRPNNPQRRDTQLLQSSGYLVMQIESSNPGVWPLHCHFAWHVSQGLYVNIVQRSDQIPKIRKLSDDIDSTCADWDQFTARQIVDQVDSGVR